MMGLLIQWFKLSPNRRRQYRHTFLVLIEAYLDIRRLSFQSIQKKYAQTLAQPTSSAHNTDDLTRQVDRVAQAFPHLNNCLVLALATQRLWHEKGANCQLKIGVKKGGRRLLQAHAWVESEGRVVIGDQGSDWQVLV